MGGPKEEQNTGFYCQKLQKELGSQAAKVDAASDIVMAEATVDDRQLDREAAAAKQAIAASAAAKDRLIWSQDSMEDPAVKTTLEQMDRAQGKVDDLEASVCKK